MWGESEDKVLLILSDVDRSLHGMVLSPAPQGTTGLSPKPVSQGSSSSFSPDCFSLPPSLPSPSFLSFALVRRACLHAGFGCSVGCSHQCVLKRSAQCTVCSSEFWLALASCCAVLCWVGLCCASVVFSFLGNLTYQFFLHGFWTLSHSLKRPSLLQGNKVLTVSTFSA